MMTTGWVVGEGSRIVLGLLQVQVPKRERVDRDMKSFALRVGVEVFNYTNQKTKDNNKCLMSLYIFQFYW